MIARIRGKIAEKFENRILLDVGGIFYEINTPSTVYAYLQNSGDDTVEMVIYHYFNIEKSRSIPVMIGFVDELEKDFFLKFIGVSGIGPKAALKAFDKPVSLIAQAIEEGNVDFLQSLAGIGKQKAKQIVAHLQGKVGRFALIKGDKAADKKPLKKETIEEAKTILKRLQYSVKETDDMINKAMGSKPSIDNVEDLLNEIYRQRK